MKSQRALPTPAFLNVIDLSRNLNSGRPLKTITIQYVADYNWHARFGIFMLVAQIFDVPSIRNTHAHNHRCPIFLSPMSEYQNRLRPHSLSISVYRSPTLFKNALVLLAADRTRLAELDEAVRLYLAWESIEHDKDQLGLDGFQCTRLPTRKQRGTPPSKDALMRRSAGYRTHNFGELQVTQVSQPRLRAGMTRHVSQ
jgi:hypothetical protein